MRKIKAFLRLSPADRSFFIRTLFVLVVIRLSLRALSFAKLSEMVSSVPPGAKAPDATEDALIERIIQSLERACRVIPSSTCLPRALTSQVIFQRHGLPTRVKIGVAKTGEINIAAHAWVEYQDRVIVGGFDPGSYAPLYTIEAKNRESARLAGR